MNMNEIKLLWDELELQNKTLFDIRHSIDMDVQHKSGN